MVDEKPRVVGEHLAVHAQDVHVALPDPRDLPKESGQNEEMDNKQLITIVETNLFCC